MYNSIVCLTARDENAGKAICGQLCRELATTNIQFHQLDITSKDSINKLQAHLQGKFGGLDVLINNSGVLFKVSDTFMLLSIYCQTFAFLMFSSAF